MTLKIANEYGNVDVRGRVPKGYVHVAHVKGSNLPALCRKLKIQFAEALVGFCGQPGYYRPLLNGVVVTAKSAQKLLQAIEDANSPAAKAEKQRRQERRHARHRERCRKIGLPTCSRTAELLEAGKIDLDTAEMVGFRNAYRHEHTDYEQQYKIYQAKYGRPLPFDEDEQWAMKEEARANMKDNPIPDTWPEYLARYDFTSRQAKAIARTLGGKPNIHPIKFKEAEIAIRRYKLDLTTLTAESIRAAVRQWLAEE